MAYRTQPLPSESINVKVEELYWPGRPSRCLYPQISAEGGEAGGRDEDRAGLRRREREDRAHAGPAGRHDVRWAHTNHRT